MQMLLHWKKLVIQLLLALIVVCCLIFWFLRNPVFFQNDSETTEKVSVANLFRTVSHLSTIYPSRSSLNPSSLNQAADYILGAFQNSGCQVEEQTFDLRGETYRNIICGFGPEDAPRLIIGAHYDVHFNNNPGADDNASGVAAIVEIARLLKKHKPQLSHRIELVAFTLEEQPHFRTSDMGSYQYAAKLFKENVPVKLMISVEMIGYYSDAPASQTYPVSFLKLLYPSRGNFIGVIGQALDRTVVKRTKQHLTVSPALPVYSINAPAFIPGIDRSDHRNFWRFKFPAVMITDTANFRNPNYHTANDTPDTLDYDRMKLVVEGLYRIATDY